MDSGYIAVNTVTMQAVDPTVYSSRDGASRAAAQSGVATTRIIMVVNESLYHDFTRFIELGRVLFRDDS